MGTTVKNVARKYGKYIAGALVIVLVAGYWYSHRNTTPGPTITAARGDFAQGVAISGTVVASRAVDLGFAANGRLAGVYAAVGQHVYAGAVLAETDNADLSAQVSQKRAALAEAQAKLDSLKAGTRPEEIAVSQAAVESAESALMTAIQSAYTSADDAVHNRADAFFANPRTSPSITFTLPNLQLKTTVEADRADAEKAFLSWNADIAGMTASNADTVGAASSGYLSRIAKLLADANTALNQAVPDQTTSAATISSYQTSLATGRTNVSAAATTLSGDRTALDSAEKSLALAQAGSTPEDVAAQEAAVAAAAADVANASAAFGKTRVVAPFSGIVTRMDAKVGEIVSPSTSEISMQSDGLFQIETYVPEVSIAEVAVGNVATTTLDAYGTATAFPAKVVAIDPAETVKDGVPTYKVTLAFENADNRIRSGMTADVRITTGVLKDAIVIPAGAVGKSPAGSYVSVIENSAVVNHPVETKTAALGQVEIVSGLSGGETILQTPATP